MKAVNKVRVTHITLCHWNEGCLLGLVEGQFQMDAGKDFSGHDRGSCGDSVVRFKKGLEKLMDKKSVEGLLEGLVRRVSSVTVVAAGVCLGSGL